jgi:hypothetical protein
MPASSTVIGVLLLTTAAVLLLFFREAELGWFRGQPLGVALAVLGVLDLADGVRRRT